MILETVQKVSEFGLALFGPACFFGWDQRYRLWRRSRSIAKLKKQRAYFVALAASEMELRAFLFGSLFILLGLLFLNTMFDALYFAPEDAVMLRLLKLMVGAGGYVFACVTAGRLRVVKRIDRYLARIDAQLARLQV